MIRYLLIAVDDERELGPQLKALRGFGKQQWKLISELTGGLSVRHLQNLEASARFCERLAVRFGVIVPQHDSPGEGDVMAGILGGGGGTKVEYIPAPTPPKPDNSEAEAAARAQRAADAKAEGSRATIVSDYAEVVKQPNALKATLGA